MPMRQSTLNFGLRASNSTITLREESLDLTVESNANILDDADTITVDTTKTITQLPTPSESATDVSSESSQTVPLRKTSQSRSKRVSSIRGRKSAFKEDLDKALEAEQNTSRCISGETLVADGATATQADLVNDISSKTDKMDIDEDEMDRLHLEAFFGSDTDSVITVHETTEDEALREEKRLAKRAKMEENAKKWEERRRIAEQHATRKSGRASLASKASELIDNIRNGVLGKRTRKTEEKEVDRSMLQGPASKKQRMGDEDLNTDEPLPRKITPRREKRWLVSGLYAGQPRMFDARLTENKNKNKNKSKISSDTEPKENWVIPLPMFAGERLLKQGRDFKLPFDVFSPLPAGQPKPDEWKKVNKNVFIGDAAAEWRTSKFDEHSTCSCKLTVKGCPQDCMNRYMYYECDERNCVFGIDWCGNRPFEALRKRAKVGGKYNVGVEVIKTADRGYGVRANRTFDPNQIIVEYTGEIITQEECESRMRTIYKDNENMIIDATRGSIARFVNHSCEPNCRMEKWTVGGRPRMALFAGDRGIMTGEELTYDYNFDPYSQKNVQQCRCGAQSCRGVLGPKPKPEVKRISPESEPGKKKKKNDSRVLNAKRKIAAILSESTSRIDKKGKGTQAVIRKSNSPAKPRANKGSPRRAVLIKKPTARKVSVSNATTKLSRSNSTLKKVLTNAKNKTSSVKGRRIPSSTSATEALLGYKQSPPVKRSSSLKEKAKLVAKSVRSRSKTIVAIS